jgi:hypothetical protein
LVGNCSRQLHDAVSSEQRPVTPRYTKVADITPFLRDLFRNTIVSLVSIFFANAFADPKIINWKIPPANHHDRIYLHTMALCVIQLCVIGSNLLGCEERIVESLNALVKPPSMIAAKAAFILALIQPALLVLIVILWLLNVASEITYTSYYQLFNVDECSSKGSDPSIVFGHMGLSKASPRWTLAGALFVISLSAWRSRHSFPALTNNHETFLSKEFKEEYKYTRLGYTVDGLSRLVSAGKGKVPGPLFEFIYICVVSIYFVMELAFITTLRADFARQIGKVNRVEEENSWSFGQVTVTVSVCQLLLDLVPRICSIVSSCSRACGRPRKRIGRLGGR